MLMLLNYWQNGTVVGALSVKSVLRKSVDSIPGLGSQTTLF